jgi:hypothetical protein
MKSRAAKRFCTARLSNAGVPWGACLQKTKKSSGQGRLDFVRHQVSHVCGTENVQDFTMYYPHHYIWWLSNHILFTQEGPLTWSQTLGLRRRWREDQKGFPTVHIHCYELPGHPETDYLLEQVLSLYIWNWAYFHILNAKSIRILKINSPFMHNPELGQSTGFLGNKHCHLALFQNDGDSHHR